MRDAHPSSTPGNALPRLLISAAHKSSGKTTVSVGLCAALAGRGLAVQAFKKGPDYIDPMWLGQACGRDCRNLDPFLMEDEEILALFRRHAAGAGISIVEGNKGLYDGLALDGSNSNAALAHVLGLPVVLVIDARGMTRGVAPLILGYQAFDRGLRIAGVILNNLGGTRHEAKLRAVIEHYTDVPVLGAIGCDARLDIGERHLGLVPNRELGDAARRIADIGSRITAQVDLDRVIAIAGSALPLAPASPLVPAARPSRSAARARQQAVRIGVARDQAFGFYYPDDLDALRAAGAELVDIDTLHDLRLPPLDGLFIGGGFPEVFMDELEANAGLRAQIRDAIEGGLPVYAECGGLMYLARSLTWKGRTCLMVGALPGDAVMHDKPVGRGYVRLAETGRGPWSAGVDGPAAELRGHEFHYSSLDNLGPDVEFAYRVLRGHGIDGEHDGIVHRNVLASYSHLRSVGGNDWALRFVRFAAKRKSARRRGRAAGAAAGTIPLIAAV
ncbi:MAG: hydrogenobyrinic acid a,c-diamide synthase (glutamine-hydrolyzing) [Burkholderiales bacterium]|nr:hydrogenobyrinic acid a,c-diamide synthase (glutamine-hydrolyzing) [Burkholderiales bacterium]